MTREEAIKIMEYRECCRECVVSRNFTCKDCETAFEMAIKALEFDLDIYLKEHNQVLWDKNASDDAIKALEQIKKIESIINGPVCMQGYVFKYMDICEVLKGGRT